MRPFLVHCKGRANGYAPRYDRQKSQTSVSRGTVSGVYCRVRINSSAAWTPAASPALLVLPAAPLCLYPLPPLFLYSNSLVPVSCPALQITMDNLQYLWDAEMICVNDDSIPRLLQVVAINIISSPYILQHRLHGW